MSEATAEIALVDRAMAVFAARTTEAPSGEDASAVPSASRTVVVLHDGRGLGEEARQAARHLAAHGFVAVAPDIRYPADPTPAASRNALADELGATLSFARSAAFGAATGLVAVLGLGAGGFPAFLAACRMDVTVAVVAYGSAVASIRRALDSELGALERSVAPVRLVLGAEDASTNVRDVAALEERLSLYRVAHDVVVYPRAGAEFLDVGSPRYRDAAAADAWERMLGWLSVTKRTRRPRRAFPH